MAVEARELVKQVPLVGPGYIESRRGRAWLSLFSAGPDLDGEVYRSN